MSNAILVNDRDNVITAVSNLKKGDDAIYTAGSDTARIKVIEDIPYGHKIAIAKIARGSFIVKYGETIGRAREDIEPGAWIHSHNTEETYAPTKGVFA